MIKFNFTTDEESFKFATEIVLHLVRLFGVSEAEAIGRLDEHWRGQRITGSNNMIYHESAEDWAKIIYHPPNTEWWKEEGGLAGRPFAPS